MTMAILINRMINNKFLMPNLYRIISWAEIWLHDLEKGRPDKHRRTDHSFRGGVDNGQISPLQFFTIKTFYFILKSIDFS